MLKRILIYLNEMFPLPSFIGTILTALSVQLTYLKLFGLSPSITPHLFLSGIYLTCITLLIRVMDEFKDYQDDLTNFPKRPLPSGRVTKKDLQVLGWGCVLLAIFVSLSSIQLVAWSIITLLFTGLMLKWFFIESVMRKSLPLAFISHHPIVLFNFVYLMIFCSHLYPQVNFSKWYFMLPLCTIFTNWEIVRKIRAPEQETAYTTYSKVWGPRVAVSVALVLQFIFTFCVFMIFKEFSSPMFLRITFGLVQFFLILPSVKFLFTLKLPAPLKPNAEGQILVVIVFLFVASLI